MFETYLELLTKEHERHETAKREQFETLVKLVQEATVFTSEETARAVSHLPPKSFLEPLAQTGRTFEQLISAVKG